MPEAQANPAISPLTPASSPSLSASPVPWTPPTGVLGTIVAEAHARAAALELVLEEWRQRALDAGSRPSLATALSQGTVGVIAEVKRQSPSKGVINAGIEAPLQAAAYASGGAAAISVLTEPVHFGGSPDDLVRVVQAVEVPILKKDFHVAPVQLYQARALGASAALLIARALSPERLRELLAAAADVQLEVVVEVRTEAELEDAVLAGATIIGVNNRDLETLQIDQTTAERLIPRIPAHCIAIAESGMTAREDVLRAADVGADAVLVGSAISAAADPEVAVRALSGVPANRHARRTS